MKRLLTLALAMLVAVCGRAEPSAMNVTPEQAEKLLKENKEIVVLDVRTPEEFADGHLAGAKNLDFLEDGFAKQLEALDKSKTYLVHCQAGGRSAKACKLMGEKFPKLYHMDGGFSAWKEAGKPVQK